MMLIPSGREYVKYLKTVLRDDKIKEILLDYGFEIVPNRPSNISENAMWFRALSVSDREKVEDVLRDGIDRVILAWLRILDEGLGNDSTYGRLKLYSEKSGSKNAISGIHDKALYTQYCDLIEDAEQS